MSARYPGVFRPVMQPYPARTSDDTLVAGNGQISKQQLHKATRLRQVFCIVTSIFLLISLVFLILVEIGNTRNLPVLRNIWFISLNLSHVVPLSVPDSVLLNSIAQSIGLHDFYQVGLWNFCEGYFSSGITGCSNPHTLYWFNPVAIITNELLSGASIALPANITNVLDIIQTASKWMFVLFLTGACLTFVLIFLVQASVQSRWTTLLIMLLSLLNAIFITVASVLATVMFIIMRNVIQENASVHITATIGKEMFAFMWVASAMAIFAWIVQLALTCCCTSRRDVRTGRKGWSEKAVVVER